MSANPSRGMTEATEGQDHDLGKTEKALPSVANQQQEPELAPDDRIQCESCEGWFGPGEMAYPASVGVWHPRCIPCENRRERDTPRNVDRTTVHEHYVRWLLREYRQLYTPDMWDAKQAAKIESHIVSLATGIDETYLVVGAE